MLFSYEMNNSKCYFVSLRQYTTDYSVMLHHVMPYALILTASHLKISKLAVATYNNYD